MSGNWLTLPPAETLIAHPLSEGGGRMGEWTTKATRYYERAAQLRATCESLPKGAMRDVMLDTADSYERLAVEFERRDVDATARPDDEPSVLIVEDESMISLVLEQLLEERAIACARVPDVGRAAELARRQIFKAAVLDVNVHNASVFPLARLLKNQGVACIFVSGYEPDVLPADFAEAAFFQKPFDPEALIAAIEDCIRR